MWLWWYYCTVALLGLLRKCFKKKLDGNYARILYTVLNKSCKQHSKQQLYGLWPSITQTIYVKQDILSTVGEVRTNSLATFFCGLLHDRTNHGQQAKTYTSSVEILDAIYRTYKQQWLIRMDVESQRNLYC